MNARTYQILSEAWAVMGYTYAGGVYCCECCPPSITGGGDDPAPIFASDDYQGEHCHECGSEI